MKQAATEDGLERARNLARRGEDEAAKTAYLAVLQADPTHFTALNDLAALLVASGHRSAARRAYKQAVALHPENPIGLVNLGNLLLEEGDPAGAEVHFRAALAQDSDFALAHQGLARILSERGEDAALHWRKGFVGHAVVTRRYRGEGAGVPLLLLVSAKLGNMATQRWIDDRIFAVTEIFAEFFDPGAPLPPHRLIVNAISDADLCAKELVCAKALAAGSSAPLINAPARVGLTGRAENARRLGCLAGVIAPNVALLTRAGILGQELKYPLLLRASGFHTGQHFARAENRQNLVDALASMPGDAFFVMDFLDSRGPDGFFRKYRALLVDGAIFPLHLAISADWKVHYFTSDMARNESFRAEERGFLENMERALGPRAVAALEVIQHELGLDYAGVDFGLDRDGSLLLYEANATMNVFPPDSGPIWDYRRPAVARILDAARRMALARSEIQQR